MQGVRRIEEAPTQAWLVRLESGQLRGIVGKGVRIGRDWLYEGGWAFTDSPRSLSLKGIYLGSGAVWNGRTLSLIAPSHSADAVYVLERPGALLASNSLPFLVAAGGISDFPITSVGRAIHSLKRGLDKYERHIFSGAHGTIHRYFNAIVTWRPGRGLTERRQRADIPFKTFDEYRTYLLTVIRQAGETYGNRGISAFVSRGYDSVACAALARTVDPESTAISVDYARNGIPDDGAEVAKALGMRSVLLRRTARDKTDERQPRETIRPEDYGNLYEFYIGMTLYDECLRAPDEMLAGRLVLTGFHGDKIWDRHEEAKPDLVRGDSSGASLGEFRLRVGFLHIPVPMLAFRAHARIKSIGGKADMIPFRTYTKYDRPVPRRIAEEAGVPGHLFGQKKAAAATLTFNLEEVAPTLFRMLTARYEPAVRALDATLWERVRSRLRQGWEGARDSAQRAPVVAPPSGIAQE